MTNNKQQTAVDILCGKSAMKLGIPQAITFYIDHQEEIAEAKAMHRDEIIEAHDEGEGKIVGNGVQYYNNTFNNENNKLP